MLNRLAFITTDERRGLGTDLLSLFGSRPTAAGVNVTRQTALRSPTTLACVRAIAETIGGIPLHLYQRGPDGARERDGDHPAAQLLSNDWCPWAGAVETRTAMMFDALLHGAGYGLIVRVGDRPQEIHRLDPTGVQVDTTGVEPRFAVMHDGEHRYYRWQDILRIATPGSTYDCLINLTDCAREAIALDIVMAQHQAKLFANGARPSGALKYKRALNADTVRRLRESFESAHSGGENSGRTLVLEDGMDFEPMQFSSTDAQFMELRRLATQEIARAFKVPGTLVGDLDRATWRNVEELMRQFVQTCLMPWAEVWQAALERALLTPDERQAYFIEAVFDDLLRGDLANRFTAYRQAAGGSWLTPNEIRALDNRPPVEGGDDLIRQAGQADATQAEAPDGV